ncbi:bifunctional UDP-N-acetylmuramoyl-tripeptide:D-alanyl-D-alanine ligase/alanine racemase [Bacteroidota bacterium]
MNYPLSILANCTALRFAGASNSNSFSHILTDTRRLISPETGLFVAISGERHKGSAYLSDAYQAGVRCFLMNESEWQEEFHLQFQEAAFALVENSLHALQQLAAWHRAQFSIPVLGITGSNGKTIVKEWLYHLLSEDCHVVRSPKSYNSQLGVPLSVLQLDSQYNLALFEAGISKVGEMKKLQAIIQPTVGIFTFLGEAHQQGFRNLGEKLEEKFGLFSSCEAIVCCVDQPEVRNILVKSPWKERVFGWSKENNQANLNFQITEKSGKVAISFESDLPAFELPFSDEASVWNACSCLAYLIYSNRISKDNAPVFVERFSTLPGLDMRLQLKEGHNGCLVINDSYSADIDSLKIALDFMNQHKSDLSSVCILSDIRESGIDKTILYQRVAQLMKAANVNQFIGIGEQMKLHESQFPSNSLFYPSTAAFLEKHHQADFSKSVILIKGARSFAFERISRLLERKVHQTKFEINLNALVNNFNTYKSLLKPGVKCMAMVKAFSYGAGSYEIARTLEWNRVDYLTVAYADEGTALREAGIKTPIMVMNPEPASFEAILKYNLEPEIYQFEILQSLIKQAAGEECGIHIELDTGMKRLGFNENQLEQLAQVLLQHPNLKVKSVFTHLAASEAPEHDHFTKEQINRFDKLSSQLSQFFSYPILRHCLNSGGIVRFPEGQFDMVRIGIGLYGIDPAEEVQQKLQVIGTLKTMISQLRTLEPDESVGYGRRGKVDKPSRIAIVAIGYADGLNRLLSNGKSYMLVNGKKAPIIGSICMDMTMINVEGIDCAEGDEVIVFGENPTVNYLASVCNTIPYEILTSISQRVKRVYFYE